MYFQEFKYRRYIVTSNHNARYFNQIIYGRNSISYRRQSSHFLNHENNKLKRQGTQIDNDETAAPYKFLSCTATISDGRILAPRMSLRVAIIKDEKLCMLIRVSGMKEHIASVLSLYVATIENKRLYCKYIREYV